MDEKLAEQFFNTMDARSDEAQEDCIHCGKRWYVMHHLDGVCHNCQKKGLPGRREIARHKKVVRWVILIGTALLLARIFIFNN